jgi:hypothetical protein
MSFTRASGTSKAYTQTCTNGTDHTTQKHYLLGGSLLYIRESIYLVTSVLIYDVRMGLRIQICGSTDLLCVDTVSNSSCAPLYKNIAPLSGPRDELPALAAGRVLICNLQSASGIRGRTHHRAFGGVSD